MVNKLTLASIHALGASCLLSGVGPADESCLLQATGPVLRRRDKNIVPSNSEFSCVPLTHHSAFSTIDVAVGTPAQVFSLVVDTGSDHIVIPSCVCQELSSKCRQLSGDRCFTGTGHSSTFRIKDGPTGPPSTVLAYGSGSIRAAVASDLVRVGKVAKDMPNGVLLMLDQQLDFEINAFEGILGLGLPTNAWPETPSMSGTSALFANQTSDVVLTKDSLSLAEVKSQSKTISKHNVAGGIDGKLEDQDETYAKIGFLQSAGVSRFSICFSDGTAGALRLNPPAQEKTLGNVGHEHWAVDFRGASIGGSLERVGFCGEVMKAGQETPCAAIPDSGSTTIMAPQEHIDLLFESLCDGWDRCVKKYTAMVTSSPSASAVENKTQTFLSLIGSCASWMDDAVGLAELPPIHFGLHGSDGTEQEIQLPGWAYITKRSAPGGLQICLPEFMAMEYITDKNGPVWIFGAPIFLTHQVGFDLRSSPPGISFTSLQNSPCGSCADGDATVALISDSVRHRRPRVVDGPRRLPTIIDTSKPL